MKMKMVDAYTYDTRTGTVHAYTHLAEVQVRINNCNFIWIQCLHIEIAWMKTLKLKFKSSLTFRVCCCCTCTSIINM